MSFSPAQELAAVVTGQEMHPGRIFFHFMEDAIGNVAQRVSAVYMVVIDGPKSILLTGYFGAGWQIINSLTSPWEKQGTYELVTSERRNAVAAECRSLQEAIWLWAGHVIKVINPNVCIDSELPESYSVLGRPFGDKELKAFQENAGLCGGRIASRRWALLELLRFEEQTGGMSLGGEEDIGGEEDREVSTTTIPGSFAYKQGKLIKDVCKYKGENCVTRWMVQQLVGRGAAVATATVAIIITVASVALGAVALTFALVLALGKNVSDSVIYSRNGGGERKNGYCKYSDKGEGYLVEEGDIRNHPAHSDFELFTQYVTFFALDNLAEVGTLMNQAHTLGLGIIRPSLLVQ